MTGAAPSLHRRILDDITGRIVSGAWPPGKRIPYEHQLATTYDCSRMTVNKALSQLAKSGLIERKRRSGSFVRSPISQSAVLDILDIRTEVEALGLVYRYEPMSRRVRAGKPREQEVFDVAGRVLVLECRHFAGDRPFCYERRFISLAAVPDAENESFTATAPGSWLLVRVPWSAAEHTIRAMAADRETSSALAIPLRSPCLSIERRTWSAEQAVTHVRLTYPADRHSLVARFTPSPA